MRRASSAHPITQIFVGTLHVLSDLGYINETSQGSINFKSRILAFSDVPRRVRVPFRVLPVGKWSRTALASGGKPLSHTLFHPNKNPPNGHKIGLTIPLDK